MIRILVLFIFITGCAPFKHGLTESAAMNSYNLVTSDPDNFGHRRVSYNIGFHNPSQLNVFLINRGYPDLIYEYKTPSKARGIRLFYVQADSVYIFEEPKKGNIRSVLKDGRKMDSYERETYQRLRTNK